MAGTAGKKALVKVSGTAVAFSSEATTSADGKTYQISSTTIQGVPWHPTTTLTVNATSGAAGDAYSVYRLNGTVVFNTSATRTITISGDYLPVSNAAEAHEFDVSLAADNLDDSAFQDTYRSRVRGIKDVTGSFTAHYVDQTYIDVLTSSSEVVVFEMHDSTSGTFALRSWARLSGYENAASIDELLQETVNFEGAADVNGNLVSFSTSGA